jgi:imidazolonepropionase-like amidohydrolase
VWWETRQVRRHRVDYRGRVLESRTELDSVGTPLLVETRGIHPRTGTPWEERFERGAASGHFVSLEYGVVFDLPLLVAALLARSDRTLPLLPDGEARLEEAGRREVAAHGERRTLTLYAVHGLDIAPEYLWLDEDGQLFADRSSVLAGWESVHRELMAASAEAVARHAAAVLGRLSPAPRDRPLVIRRARLFDPARRTVTPATSVVIRGNRVAAVGPDDSIDVPPGAEVMDAAGRTVLPGLWDMHVHMHEGFIEELDAPLFVAAGVTTVRDMGGDTRLLTSLRDRGVAGTAIAPRILPALIMYGPGQYPWGAAVGTPEEARDAVDRFAALGYVQVKLYNPVPPELVPVIIERARQHGMRVSGHLPNGMTGRDVMDAGFDEIQHLFYARIAAADARLGADPDLAERMAAVRPETEDWRQFVDLLLEHDVVIDPSLAVVEETVGGQPPRWLGAVIDRFPSRAGRMAVRHVGPAGPPGPLRDHWDEIVANGPALVKSLHDAGVMLVAGTDAQIGGFELQRELEIYVEAGIPAADVLAMATLGAARIMGMDVDLGSIEPGKLADLIVVDGDPAEHIGDIRRVVSVVKDGRVYDPAAIYSALGLAPCCGSHPPAVESVQTPEALAPAPVARALANDHTERAGRMVAGELHVELEAVEAEWFPLGPEGPRIVTPAFAEVGRAPSVPGPLIRAAAGTPVVVTVTNRLERAIQVRGLDERKSAGARPPGSPSTFPEFFFADSLVIPAGEGRTVRFRQGRELTSFYYARTIPPAGVLAPPSAVPGESPTRAPSWARW